MGPVPRAAEARMTDPVAVVIPTYNHSRFLADAIASVERQTVPAAEIIVVDDGSTDHPEHVVAQFPGVRLIRQDNKGLAAARNTGLSAASSDKVIFLDADDLLAPDAIESGLACFSNHLDAGFVYGAHRMVNAEGVPISKVKFEEIGPDPFVSFLKGNCIGMHATVLYDRQRLVACGGFNETLRRCEDYDLYLRLGLKHPVASHPTLVADYRWHGANMSSDILEMLNWVLRVQGAFAERARQDPTRSRAFDEGREIWRTYYSERCLDQIRREREVGRKLASAAAAVQASPRFALGRLASMTVRKLARRGPRSWTQAVRQLTGQRGGSAPRVGSFRFGDFASVAPACADFGYTRGLPIDRYYVEAFLAGRSPDIRGRALEIGDASYCRRFGEVAHQDVLHVDAGAPEATITGDLSQTGVLPLGVYDCMVITQTLHLIYDMPAAIREMHRALKPGGVLLLTSPGISRIDRGDWKNTWYWSLTEASIRRLFFEAFGDENCDVGVHGNVYAATCFLQGLALDEVDRKKLDVLDPSFPLILTVRACKSAHP
jgi:glycosyltransferase involved in cell wall biosynthesis/SAM-dependent methyltransferase